MISVILPYWNRQAAADNALWALERTYAGLGLDLEIIVVDDGSPVPFKLDKSCTLNVRVLRLPGKTEPKSPATCWNEGVRDARGETIVLSCIEVLHDRIPVLPAMLEELKRSGPDGYVLAAAHCPETGEWHCHSQHTASGSYPIPKGTGRGFCAMLSKALYWRAGGWDEEYREGAGYEDVDFIYRLINAGARFVMRDDLVVTHPKTGASIAWGAAKFERNKALFEKKWHSGRKVTFACVQAQNYCGRGAEYVNKLFDMVQRNMPRGVMFRFVCLTDDSAGLHPDIEMMPLPKDLEGWYGKLYLFKRGVFAEGERVIFMDLDTVILGKLDDLVNYDGQFGTLEDFFFPERVGPAVIAWQAGPYASSIWEEWCAEDKPRNPLGDLWWLNNLGQGRFAREIDKLQKLFPGTFVSYKRDCSQLPPKGARVVCFHGKPRPHEAAEKVEWVARAWDVGGMTVSDFEVVGNTDFEQTAKNIAYACTLPVPWLPHVTTPTKRSVAIVGGGPSLHKSVEEIRYNQKAGMLVFATNGAHDYLIERGIAPDAHVIIDARPENAKFITRRARAYFLASQCDRSVFDLAAGSPITLVHMHTRDVDGLIPEGLQPINLISSGPTVGLAAMALSYCIGHRMFYLYGMDSSYEDGTHHAYAQAGNDHDRPIEAVVGGRTFHAAPWMVAQVEHFQKLAAELAGAGCEIHVRSGGMLGHLAWVWMNQPKALDAAA